MMLDDFATGALEFGYLPSKMERCTRWLLITWFSAGEESTPRFSTVEVT